MTMKTINVAKLKSRLSEWLRLAAAGEEVVVLDRTRPIARIVPLDAPAEDCWESLARAGRIRLGSQDWSTLKITPVRRRISAQKLLDDVRGDR